MKSHPPLASPATTWQGSLMNGAPSRPPSPRSAAPAGGVLIAIGAIGGAFVGAAMGEATRGFLIGVATGVVLAGAIWWRSRD